jgi:hypothetical protein
MKSNRFYARFGIVLLSLTFILCQSAALSAPEYISADNYLSVLENDLDGTGFWVDQGTEDPWTPAMIEWEVYQNQDLSWHYSYTLTVHRADISHFIIETCSTFDSSNISNVQPQGAVLTISSFVQDGGNPFMPGSIYGVKFDNISGTDLNIAFDSDKAPIWGDFYAKCGATGGTQNTVWNTGFTSGDTDPSDLAANGTISNHLLVPGCEVPEPATMLLLIS